MSSDCPFCDGKGEVPIEDGLVDCPGCLGTGIGIDELTDEEIEELTK